MSKAEEEANKRYSITRGDDTEETSGIDMQRASDFIEGYHQAEKDLEFTWRDIEQILDIINNLVDENFNADDFCVRTDKEFYQEVLKRFNRKRNERLKTELKHERELKNLEQNFQTQSNMDYEKKYKEALERAREFVCKNNVEVAEYIFPELSESEDERIRKDILSFLRTGKPYSCPNSQRRNKWADWLEKQGEQNPFNYENATIVQKDFAPIEPRYNIGDVLCDKSCTTLNKDAQPNFEIVDIKDGLYICDKGSIPISQQDEYELVAKKIEQKSNNNQFTPEQADVLDKHIDKLIEQNPATDFSDLRTWKYIVDAVWTEKEGIGQYLDSPFTEEFAKKLQKRFGNIEQKSTDKATSTTFSYITPNQKFFQWIYDRLIYVHNENPDVGYMRSLKERIEDMQKPAWSEEDEIALGDALWCCKQAASIAKDENDMGSVWYAERWLKSLKDKVVLQQKQEWCEEDEKKRTLLISILEVNHPNGYFKVNPANTLNMEAMRTEELVSWLKSLRPQTTWKPSEEQMEALESATENCAYSEYQDCLRELIGQLKKLKG